MPTVRKRVRRHRLGTVWPEPLTAATLSTSEHTSPKCGGFERVVQLLPDRPARRPLRHNGRPGHFGDASVCVPGWDSGCGPSRRPESTLADEVALDLVSAAHIGPAACPRCPASRVASRTPDAASEALVRRIGTITERPSSRVLQPAVARLPRHPRIVNGWGRSRSENVTEIALRLVTSRPRSKFAVRPGWSGSPGCLLPRARERAARRAQARPRGAAHRARRRSITRAR